jgi:hypothetical protein
MFVGSKRGGRDGVPAGLAIRTVLSLNAPRGSPNARAYITSLDNALGHGGMRSMFYRIVEWLQRYLWPESMSERPLEEPIR